MNRPQTGASNHSAGGAVLVCGGAGYIGSHVVRALLDAGRTPVVIDDLSAGHRRAVAEGVEIVAASIGDRHVLDDVFERLDVAAVMHFCANAHVGESVRKPRKYYRNNLANGLTLLEAVIDHDVKGMVFSSSCTVYGRPERIPIDEDCAIRPISPYGRTKAIFEQVLEDFSQAYGLRSVSLRYFNAAGAALDASIGEHHDPETHLIPSVLHQALREKRPDVFDGDPKPLVVHGEDYHTRDGTCVRDYIHVLDLVDAHLLALEHLEAGGGSVALNLANGTGFSVHEVIEACRRVTGAQIAYTTGPRREGDPPELVGSSRLAQRVLGWKPRHPAIDQIVSSAWKWHWQHPLGFAE